MMMMTMLPTTSTSADTSKIIDNPTTDARTIIKPKIRVNDQGDEEELIDLNSEENFVVPLTQAADRNVANR